ncbi:hypothetical protein PQG02_27070 [Nostoc sp. UHCC 0926]|nr:hypothetical protein PQG02_27070 [Nostoc sp. UHCC 0926]
MPNVRLHFNCGRAEIEVHFQPEALNEVLNGFALTAVFKYLNHICRRGARPCAPTAWSIYLKIAVIPILSKLALNDYSFFLGVFGVLGEPALSGGFPAVGDWC